MPVPPFSLSPAGFPPYTLLSLPHVGVSLPFCVSLTRVFISLCQYVYHAYHTLISFSMFTSLLSQFRHTPSLRVVSSGNSHNHANRSLSDVPALNIIHPPIVVHSSISMHTAIESDMDFNKDNGDTIVTSIQKNIQLLNQQGE